MYNKTRITTINGAEYNLNNFSIYPLKSGSKGNSYLITNGETNILADCGISAKGLSSALSALGLSCDEICAAVISHEHSDHIKGVGAISRKYGFPIYTTRATWRAMWNQVAPICDEYIKIINPNEAFSVGDIKITPFPLSHDAADPVGYSFSENGKKISIITDTGCVTNVAEEALLKSDIAVIEANHDENMLLMGKYPPLLKRRIKSDMGHLSNEAAGYLASRLIKSGTKKIILGHLSEENNYPSLALLTVKNIIAEEAPNLSYEIIVAKKDGDGSGLSV